MSVNKNKLFIAKINWLVILFYELQVVKYPDACCKAIAQIISQITGNYRGLVQLQNFDNLLPHKQWTVKEATYMAKIKFRKSYLRHNWEK